MKNELGGKLFAVAAGPSDALALAFAANAPVVVLKEMLDRCRDAAPLLRKLRERDPGIKF